MTLAAMLADLPRACDVGAKRNAKGYKETWIGYKLHPSLDFSNVSSASGPRIR
jgi:hypothetical protein